MKSIAFGIIGFLILVAAFLLPFVFVVSDMDMTFIRFGSIVVAVTFFAFANLFAD